MIMTTYRNPYRPTVTAADHHVATMLKLNTLGWIGFFLVYMVACQQSFATPPTTSIKGVVALSDAPQLSARKNDQTIEKNVETWLDRIEAKAATVQTLHADLIYDRIQQLVGDRQRRFGTLVFDFGPPEKFSIHFDRLLVDRRLDHDNRRYIFDGQWLTERYDHEKLLIKRQINPPTNTHANGLPDDPLALGSGPFVIPIRVNKNQLLNRFKIRLIPFEKGDPPTTIHFQLIPFASQVRDVTEMNLWYNHQTLLPVRISTVDDSENESLIHLKHTRINQPIDAKIFDATPPEGADWRVEVNHWTPNQ